MTPIPIPVPSIVPPSREAFVEVLVFGLRNLAPFQLLGMTNVQVRSWRLACLTDMFSP
jgi:hypothetical protein